MKGPGTSIFPEVQNGSCLATIQSFDQSVDLSSLPSDVPFLSVDPTRHLDPEPTIQPWDRGAENRDIVFFHGSPDPSHRICPRSLLPISIRRFGGFSKCARSTRGVFDRALREHRNRLVYPLSPKLARVLSPGRASMLV